MQQFDSAIYWFQLNMSSLHQLVTDSKYTVGLRHKASVGTSSSIALALTQQCQHSVSTKRILMMTVPIMHALHILHILE